MLAKRIIPCLDIKDGKVVKGVQFRGLQDIGDPVALAEFYGEQGADELVFYDITASVENRGLFLGLLRQVAATLFIPLTVGGGIQRLQDFQRVLEAGADKVSVNSGALKNPALIREAAERYGNQCVVLSVDVGQVGDAFHVFTKGGQVDTGRLALPWILEGVGSGAGEVVVNTIDTDGCQKGYHIEFLKQVCAAVPVPVIASGGAGSVDDFVNLFQEIPVMSGALAASVFHRGLVEIEQVKNALASQAILVRRKEKKS